MDTAGESSLPPGQIPEQQIGRLTSIRLPTHIASPALSPSKAVPASATPVVSGIWVSAGGTPALTNEVSAVAASSEASSRIAPPLPPPTHRSREGSVGHNLHPSATPLCRFSFYSPPTPQQTMLLPLPLDASQAAAQLIGPPQAGRSAVRSTSIGSVGYVDAPVPAARASQQPTWRLRSRTSSSVFAPNLGGEEPASSSDESELDRGRGHGRVRGVARIARLHSHGSLPAQAAAAAPHRDALMAIAMARGIGAARSTATATAAVSDGGAPGIERLPSIRERERRRAARDAVGISAPGETGDDASDNDAARRRASVVSVGVQTDADVGGVALVGPQGMVHAAIARLRPSRRVRNLFLVALITLGSGVTMFINGIAGALQGNRGLCVV